MADARRPTQEVVLRPGDPVDSGPSSEPAPDVPLLDAGDTEAFLRRWSEVQARFVDDPQAAVTGGDRLVGELLQALAARFAAVRADVERSARDGAADTEQLRLALQSYRSCFQRLLRT